MIRRYSGRLDDARLDYRAEVITGNCLDFGRAEPSNHHPGRLFAVGKQVEVDYDLAEGAVGIEIEVTYDDLQAMRDICIEILDRAAKR